MNQCLLRTFHNLQVPFLSSSTMIKNLCTAMPNIPPLWNFPFGVHSSNLVSSFASVWLLGIKCKVSQETQSPRLFVLSNNASLNPNPREPDCTSSLTPLPAEWPFISILCFLCLRRCPPKYHFWKIIFKWLLNSESKFDHWLLWICCWLTTRTTLVIRNDVAPPRSFGSVQGSYPFLSEPPPACLIKRDAFPFCIS